MIRCRPAPALGGSRTYTFRFVSFGTPNGEMEVRVTGERENGKLLPEKNGDDNSVKVRVRTAP